MLRQNLCDKERAIDQAEGSLKSSPVDSVGYLLARFADLEFVLFCGAGISIPRPASAPSFLELRTSVILSVVDLLIDRNLILDANRSVIETAMGLLDTRPDLTLPPEYVFQRISAALGFDLVSRLLSHALDRGVPNENHIAIQNLIRPSGPRLSGVITPNFDLYIERALESVAMRRTVAQTPPVGEGFPLFKPHGSLDQMDTIAITFDRIVHPLKGMARQTFKNLTARRMIVVVGYSGWDYDLLPLLVYASREWGSEITWVLHDESSINERTALVQLALENRCMFINSQQRALLPVLAGIEERRGRGEYGPLREGFANILSSGADDALIAALIDLIVPSGVSESSGVVQHLCSALVRMAESNEIKDDGTLLKRLGQAVAWSEKATRVRAARLAVECARRLKNDLAIRSFERTALGEDESQRPDTQLRRVEQDLQEFPFDFKSDPEPEEAARMTRADLRIEAASLLMELRRFAEAGTLVRQILDDTRFPESSVAEDAWNVGDAHAPWKLHAILGRLAAREGKTGEMESEFCKAIDVLWREFEFWDLVTALRHVASAASRWDRRTAEAAMTLSVRVARYSMDQLSELVAIEWKIEYGFGSPTDLKRAETLLNNMKLTQENRKRHIQTLNRVRKHVS